MLALTRNSEAGDSPVSNTADHLPRHRTWWCGLLAAIAWLTAAWFTKQWPDTGDVGPTTLLAGCMAAIGIALLAATVVSLFADFHERFRGGPWLIALAFLLGFWELGSAKLNLLPRPFFATPQSLLAVYMEDWPRLLESTRHWLLAASGAAIHWTFASDGMAAAGILRIAVELECERVSDRAGHRIPCCRVDLVRHRGR
jgi:NitT/TauT family transport system permease protein